MFLFLKILPDGKNSLDAKLLLLAIGMMILFV